MRINAFILTLLIFCGLIFGFRQELVAYPVNEIQNRIDYLMYKDAIKWDKYYDSAVQIWISDKHVGLTSSEVKRMLGEPEYKSKAKFLPGLPESDEQWIYGPGGPGTMYYFMSGTCIGVDRGIGPCIFGGKDLGVAIQVDCLKLLQDCLKGDCDHKYHEKYRIPVW